METIKKILFRKIADFQISWLALTWCLIVVYCVGLPVCIMHATKYQVERTKHTIICTWQTPDGKTVPQLNMQFKVGEERPAGCYLRDTNHVSCQVDDVGNWLPFSVVGEYEKNGKMEFADDVPNPLRCHSEFEELDSKKACVAGGVICNFGLSFKPRERTSPQGYGI